MLGGRARASERRDGGGAGAGPREQVADPAVEGDGGARIDRSRNRRPRQEFRPQRDVAERIDDGGWSGRRGAHQIATLFDGAEADDVELLGRELRRQPGVVGGIDEEGGARQGRRAISDRGSGNTSPR